MSAAHRRTRRRAELSQHFLHVSQRGGATAARIVHGASIAASDFVVEVGPGRGALTRPLVKNAGRVVAVELDRRLAATLRDEFGDRAEIVHADFLTWPLPAQPYKIVGNVPFGRTTQIVRKLVNAPNPPTDAWLVVQREAAYRFVGAPYLRETSFSLRLKPAWHVEVVDRLRRTDFDPPPSVESVVVWLHRRFRTLLTDAETHFYAELIGNAYPSRLTVDRALRPWLSKPQIRGLARDLRFELADVPSALSFEQWLGIVRFAGRHRVI